MTPADARQPVQTALPRRFYADPDYYRAELERLFFGRWIAVGRADQIPQAGDYFTRSLADDSLIVTRDGSGAIQALFNVCRHRGTRLCDRAEGHFVDRIQCPYHAWTYDLSGRLLAAPHMPAAFCPDDYPLRRAASFTWGGHILAFPGSAPPAPPRLPEFSRYHMEDLRLGRRVVYDVRANWKLVVLNFNECLHCPTLHPALNRLHHYLGAENVPPTPFYCGGAMGFKPGVETMSVDGKRRRPFLPGLDDAARQQVAYYTIYPNLLLSLHPDYMMTHTLWPRAHDRTEIICEWHFHRDEIAHEGFIIADAVEFWDQTNREDWWIAEQSQLGIQSRAYEPGPYSDREALLWSFDQLVRASQPG